MRWHIEYLQLLGSKFIKINLLKFNQTIFYGIDKITDANTEKKSSIF